MVSTSNEERNKRRRQKYAMVAKKKKQDALKQLQVRHRLHRDEQNRERMRKSRNDQSETATLDR